MFDIGIADCVVDGAVLKAVAVVGMGINALVVGTEDTDQAVFPFKLEHAGLSDVGEHVHCGLPEHQLGFEQL